MSQIERMLEFMGTRVITFHELRTQMYNPPPGLKELLDTAVKCGLVRVISRRCQGLQRVYQRTDAVVARGSDHALRHWGYLGGLA